MSLICWLPLNQDLHNQGISNLVKANVSAATVLENNGKIGKCYTNTGTTASVATPLILNTIAFSACAWVRINTSRANWCRAFGMGGTNTYFGLGCEHSNGTLLGFHFYKTIDGTNTSIFDNYPTSKQVGTWVHYAMTYDGEKAYLYENGNLLNTLTIATARQNTRCEMTNLYLFGGTSGNYSQCSLNDVRIYDHCLSAAEVKEIAQGLILHYKMNGSMGGSGENLFTNTNRWYTATSAAFATTTGYPSVSFTKDLQQLVGKTICFSFELYTPGTRTNGSGNLGNRFGAHLSLNYTPSGGSATQAYPCAAHLTDTITEEHYRVSSTYTVPSNCTVNSFGMSIQPQAKPGDDNTATWKIGQFKVEFGNVPTSYSPAPIDFGMNGTTIEDSSGFGNIGTAVGNLTTLNDTSRYSVSTYVGTTSKDYISTPNLLFENMKQGTVNIWIKRKSTDSTWRLYTFFANSYNWTGNSSDFIIIGSTGGQAIVLDCCSNTYSFTPDLNKWYMYTISWNLETHQAWMYVNGELKATKNSANIDTTYASKHNGHYFGNSHSEVGDYLMSDARIYCTQLLDTDIKQLYNVGMKVDKLGNSHPFEIDEGTGTQITKTGILKSEQFLETGIQFNANTGFTFKPAANTNNSTTGGIGVVDFSRLRYVGTPITITISCDVAWSNIGYTSTGTNRLYFQGANRLIETGATAWQGSNYLTGWSILDDTKANATGNKHFEKTVTIPATWFEIYDGSQFGMKCDYSDGNGTVTVSNVHVILTSENHFKIKKKNIVATQFIER